MQSGRVDVRLPKSKHTTHRPKKCTPVATRPLGRAYNELGTFITLATNNFEQFGWHETCRRMRSRSDITEDIGSLPHRAAPLLARLRLHGAPVILKSEPWPIELIEKRFRRGPHRSALEYADFLQDEFFGFCTEGVLDVAPI